MKRLATRISQIFHPVPVSLATATLAIILSNGKVTNPVYWIGLSTAIVLTPITLYYVYGMRQEGFREKELRNKIYLRGVALAVVFTAFVFVNNGPDFVKILSTGVSISGVVFGLLNERLKVSVHTGVFSGASAVVFMLEPVLGGVGFSLLPLVAWSRVELDRHTPAQVLLGSVIPVTVFGLAFWLGSS